MKWFLGMPAKCVSCATQTVIRIKGEPLCAECLEREPPERRGFEELLALGNGASATTAVQSR